MIELQPVRRWRIEQLRNHRGQAVGEFGLVVWWLSLVLEVDIDVQPGASNNVNPRSHGAIPVAILTTSAFDATGVDPASVRFGATGVEAAANHHALDDVETSTCCCVSRARRTASPAAQRPRR